MRRGRHAAARDEVDDRRAGLRDEGVDERVRAVALGGLCGEILEVEDGLLVVEAAAVEGFGLEDGRGGGGDGVG